MKAVAGASGNYFPSSPSRQVPVVDREKADPEIVKAAEGMEAMFLEYMMKVMRDTVPKNEMDMENPASRIYRSLHDGEISQQAARAGGVGLADQIIAYLEAARYTENAVRSPRTGGTHEGQ